MRERHQEVINRIEHMYKDIDGNINYPNSYDGDVLKIAYESAKASLIPLNDEQKIVLKRLRANYRWFGKSVQHALYDTLTNLDDIKLSDGEFIQVLKVFLN